MNRRTAMMLTMLLGGLVPRGLWAQETRSRRTSDSSVRPHQGPRARRQEPDGR